MLVLVVTWIWKINREEGGECRSLKTGGMPKDDVGTCVSVCVRRVCVCVCVNL